MNGYKRIGHWAISVPILIFLAVSTRQLFDESVGYPDADRILMDGVFIADLFRELPLNHALDFGLHYYAQYPALSLGYRPPFLPLVEALFVMVFGVTTWSGRLGVLAFGCIGLVFWHKVVSRLYDEWTALIAAVLLGSLPFVANWSWYTMAEIPVMAMVMVSCYGVVRYVESNRRRWLYFAAVTYGLALWTKQTAVFAAPWFLAYLLIERGPRVTLSSRDFWGAVGVVCLLALPIAVMTVSFGDLNLAQSVGLNPRGEQAPRCSWGNLRVYLDALWSVQLTMPVVIMGVIGLGLGLKRRDTRLRFLLLGIAATYLFFTAMNDPKTARYTIYWVPLFCTFAALPMAYVTRPRWRRVFAMVVIVAVCWNLYKSFQKTPQYISGYREAASYVVSHNPTRTVLIDAYNNGYFTFFMRSIDRDRRQTVLRGDKLLSSSAIETGTWQRVYAHCRDDIQKIIYRHGVGLIVVESQDYTGLPIHQELRKYLNEGPFVLRRSIPIKSNVPRYQGQMLNIYEYNDAKDGEDGDLILDLPVVGKRIHIRSGEVGADLVPLSPPGPDP